MSLQLQDVLSRLQRRTQPLDLTPRELQVIRLVAQGLMSKEVAFELGSARKTIDNHRATIMEKLGAKSAAHMVWIACRRGLV